MKTTNGAIDRAADRLMTLDSASYGDERERAVFMAATTFGMTVTMYVAIPVALVAALLGQLLLPVVVLLLVGLPSWATMWYAGRRGVDVSELAFRAEPGTKRIINAIVFGGFALILAALAYTVFVGHGVVDLSAPDLESGPIASMVKGGVVGGAGGLLVAAVGMAVQNHRRARRGTPAEDEALEED